MPDLKALIAEARGNLSSASQVVQECVNTVRDKPTEAMAGDVREKYESAKVDVEKYGKELGGFRTREKEIAEADGLDSALNDPDPTKALNYQDPRDADVVIDDGGRMRREPHRDLNGRSLAARGKNMYMRGLACHPAYASIGAKAHAAMQELYLREGAAAVQDKYAEPLSKLPVSARNALITGSGELGGFVTRIDFRDELLTDIAAMSAMMRISRIIPTLAGEVSWPTMQSSSTPRRYKSGFTGKWRTEGEESPNTANLAEQNQPQFGLTKIPIYAWSPDTVPITTEMLEDEAFDIERTVIDVGSEHAALEWEDKFINGDGDGEPLGILDATNNIGFVTVTDAAQGFPSHNGMADLVYGSSGLASQWRNGASALMHSSTYGELLKESDGSDRPLINVYTSPDTIHGRYPIEFSEWMPAADGTTLQKLVVFGNFNHYGIGMRSDIRVIRMVEQFAPGVGIKLYARIGGKVLRSNGFKILRGNA